MGGCLSLAWTSWRDKDAEAWGVEVLRVGYKSHSSLLHLCQKNRVFHFTPHLQSKEILALESKGALELVSPSPGFFSRMLVVTKATGGWRPIIDLSHLNRFVAVTKFKMETVQSVILSVRPDDWMVSIDLKDAYLQVPIHPESRKYLRFVIQDSVFPGKGLSSSNMSTVEHPSQFTKVIWIPLRKQGI